MPIAYWCILVAAMLPLGLVAYAKSSSRDNHSPRDAADRLTGEKRRAYAAHQMDSRVFRFSRWPWCRRWHSASRAIF